MSFFKYNGNVLSSVEDLLAELKMDGIDVEQQDDWQIQKYTSFKEYDAVEFLRMAEKYKNESPPDLIQSSEKLWLAVVYTIKLFFLNMDYHLASHRSLTLFYDLAAEKLSIVKLVRRLDKAWQLAEKLHSFAYGTPAFTIVEFPDVYAEIKFFIEEFPKIEGSKIKLEINNLMEDVLNGKRKDINFCMFTDKVKPKIGNKQYSPKYKFY